MDSERKSTTRRWYKARQRELRAVMWEWDPLGIMGVADDEYDCLIDPLIGELARGIVEPAALKAVLRRELEYMGGSYSSARAEAESRNDALGPIVQRISSWWESVPARP